MREQLKRLWRSPWARGARRTARYVSGLTAELRRGQDPYLSTPSAAAVSPQALAAAHAIRGPDHAPAIMLHGVMPRSGSVYVAELLRQHPDLHAYPNDLWEVPLLELAPGLRRLQQRFIAGYRQNQARMQDDDFLPLFGSAFLSYLRSCAGSDGKRLLVKEAGVLHLRDFPVVFPWEQLLLLLRDGRDLVHSSLRTWPDKSFDELCRTWGRSTRAALDYAALHQHRQPACWLVKYEDVQADPAAFARQACRQFALDPARYPFDALADVQVIGSSTVSAPGEVDWRRRSAPPENFRPVGHWESWQPRRKQRFKDIAGDVLVAAGYARDHEW